MLSVPSVTMNGFITRPLTSTSPLTAPTSAPASTIVATTTGPESPASTPSTPASATTEPTERSIPRVRITSSWPSASTATIDVWKPRFVRLRSVRKYGLSSVIASGQQPEDQHRPGLQHAQPELEPAVA